MTQYKRKRKGRNYVFLCHLTEQTEYITQIGGDGVRRS